MSDLKTEIKIRAAVPADFLEVAALDRVAWQDSPGGEWIPDGEHVWRIWCEHALVMVGDDGAQICAVGLAFPCCQPGVYCLHKIMVGAESRGLGLGTRLLAELCAVFDERKITAFLTVFPDNAPARRLYERFGFGQSRFCADFYRTGEDRLVLTRLPGE